MLGLHIPSILFSSSVHTDIDRVAAIRWIFKAFSPKDENGKPLTKTLERNRGGAPENRPPDFGRESYTVTAAKGSVIAAPDDIYFYYWRRDGALVMREIFELSRNLDNRIVRSTLIEIFSESLGREVKTTELKALLNECMTDYLAFVELTMSTGSMHGRAKAKYNADGSIFVDPWMDPQIDGPALHAQLFSEWALELRKENFAQHKDLISRIYRTVQAEIGYLQSNWKKMSFDIWEEIPIRENEGSHFYTLMSIYDAAHFAANLARVQNENDRSIEYLKFGEAMRPWLMNHWNPEEKYIFASRNMMEGADRGKSNLDAQVVLAIIHRRTPASFLPLTHDWVLSTVIKKENVDRRIYPINKDCGMACWIGRYEFDHFKGGNPWMLATDGWGEFYMRAASEWEAAGAINRISDLNYDFFKALEAGIHFEKGEIIGLSDPRFKLIISALREKALAFAALTSGKKNSDGSRPEQIHKQTGEWTSVERLTWSCASVLSYLRSAKETAQFPRQKTLQY